MPGAPTPILGGGRVPLFGLLEAGSEGAGGWPPAVRTTNPVAVSATRTGTRSDTIDKPPVPRQDARQPQSIPVGQMAASDPRRRSALPRRIVAPRRLSHPLVRIGGGFIAVAVTFRPRPGDVV